MEMPDSPDIAMDRPASPYMVQKWIRELFCLPRVRVDAESNASSGDGALMSMEEALLTPRYGNRHFASNVVRCGDASLWPLDVRKKVSNWGSISEMPDRYSQETADMDNYKIRIAILDMIWKAVQRTPIANWPAFGGWHLLSAHLPSSSKPLLAATEHFGKDVEEPDELCFGDDLAGSDFEEFSDDDDADDAEPSARLRSRKVVPAGWSAVVGNRSSGATYIKHYLHAASGEKLRSIKEIESRASASGSAPQVLD